MIAEGSTAAARRLASASISPAKAGALAEPDRVATSTSFFFFKQKTAYEMAQCDWSSDVCSSDVVLGDALGKARAAVAEDAALTVEGDGRRDRDRLLERALGELHPRVARAPAEGQVLQRALAALVADRAVERVVDEDELERRVLALGRLRRGLRGAHLHPVGRSHRAAGLELRHTLELDEAHPAGPDRRPDARLVAEDRDLDPRGERGLDEPEALGHLHLAAVDRDGDELRRAHAGTSATGEWVCWSDGATIPSTDDSPPNGQPPCSTWATNSSCHLSK